MGKSVRLTRNGSQKEKARKRKAEYRSQQKILEGVEAGEKSAIRQHRYQEIAKKRQRFERKLEKEREKNEKERMKREKQGERQRQRQKRKKTDPQQELCSYCRESFKGDGDLGGINAFVRVCMFIFVDTCVCL